MFNMKTPLIYLFLIVFNAISFCQVSEERFNFLLISADYSTNTSTFGISVPETKQPNLITSATFVSATNFDISYAGIVTDNADSTLTQPAFEHDLMLGYNINIGEDFIIYPAYTHLFHSKNSYALISAFTDILQLDFTLYKKNYNGSLSTNYLFGSKDMVYISLQNALEIEADNFIFNNSNLNLQLGVTLNFSDKNYYNKNIYDSWNGEDFLQWVYNYQRVYFRDILQILNENNNLKLTKQILYEHLDETQPDVFGPLYAITSIDIYFPIYYSIKSFMLNVTGNLNVPIAESPFFSPETTFLFSAGISYVFTF